MTWLWNFNPTTCLETQPNLHNYQQLDYLAIFILCRKYLLSRISHMNNPNEGMNQFSGHGTTNTILRKIKYFQTLIKGKGNFTP